MNMPDVPADNQRRVAITNEIFDTVGATMDADVRTETITYADAKRLEQVEQSERNRLARHALIHAAEFTYNRVDPSIVGELSPESSRRVLETHNSTTGDNIGYAVTDIRAEIGSLSRIATLYLSDGHVNRTRSVAIDAGGISQTHSVIRMPMTDFERFAYRTISDKDVLILAPLLNGSVPAYRTFEESIGIIQQSVAESGSGVNPLTFVTELIRHFDERLEANDLARHINGSQEMSIAELEKTLDFVNGDDLAIGIYTEDDQDSRG